VATQTFAAAGSGTWLCPNGVTQIQVECWGSGSGGEDETSGTTGGLGGGGGEYAAEPAFTVVPGTVYSFTVGAGGAHGSSGQATVFAGAVIANGAVLQFGGTSSTNSVTHDGGQGGTATSTGGGGGGGSGGSAAAGNNGSNSTTSTGASGASAVTGGGPGGAGGNNGVAGAAPGSGPGGGGGGAGKGKLGGAGHTGQITLTFTVSLQPAVPVFIAGYAPLAADFDGWVQAPFAFLTSRVVFRAELTNSATWTNNVDVVIPFNSIIEDPFSGWNSGSSAWECPAGYSGTYEVSVTVSTAAAADAVTKVEAAAGLNGAITYTCDRGWVPQTSAGIVSGSAAFQLYGGSDTISGWAFYASSGGNGTPVITAGQRCTIEITWISL